jgi:hypothetical protein
MYTDKISMRKKLIMKQFKNYENLFFYCLLIIGLAPLFTQKYFVTLDGPAHLYNGVLIKSLLQGNYPEINHVFQFNTFPVPNWIGHFLFAFFSLFLPDYLTEKMVLFLYLFITPFIFRKLVLFLAPENKTFSYLMILFVHNYLFYLGFFNLSFGILAMFLTLYYYYKHREEISVRNVPILSGLMLLTYFSHLLPLMILLFILIILPFGMTKVQWTSEGIVISNIKPVFKNLIRILLAALPALILTAIYLIKIDSVEDVTRTKLTEIFPWILYIKPLLTLKVGFPWKTYTLVLFLLFIVLAITALLTWIKTSTEKNDDRLIFKGRLRCDPIFWLTFSIGFLLLFLILPNTNLLSERLIFFFYLFFILGLALLHYPKWIHYTALMIILVIHFSFTIKSIKLLGSFSSDVELLKEATNEIEPESLILTINNNDNWRYMHISGYIGSDRPMAVLENYEAGLQWFPLKWNPDYYQVADINEWNVKENKTLSQLFFNRENPNVFSLKTKKNSITAIPYVLVLGPLDSHPEKVTAEAREVLDRFYIEQKKNSFCTLYILKK